MSTSTRDKYRLTTLVFLAIGFIAAVIISNTLFSGLRIDLTEGKLYTLSDGTKRLVRNIDEPLNLTFYYSDRATENVPPLRSYARRVRELLQEFERTSDGNIELSVIDPLPFSEDEDRAAQFGLQAVSVPSASDPIYLGLVGTNSVGDDETIAFFQPDKERFLEYDIARLVATLATPERTVIGLLSGVSMTGGFNPQTQQMSPGWVIDEQVRQLFDVRPVPTDVTAIDEDISVLWIVQPKNLPPATVYAIDQYILGGGKALIFVDPLAEADTPPPNPQMPQMPQMGQSSTIEALFEAWGVDFDTQTVVADVELGLSIAGPGGRPVRHAGIIGVDVAHLADDDVVTADLDTINVSAAGTLSLAEDAPVKLEPLIRTSLAAMTMASSRLSFLPDPAALLDGYTAGGEELVLAARVGGTPPSAFPDGPQPDSVSSDADTDGTPPEGHLSEAADPINVILVADVDLLSDRLWVQSQNFFGRRIATAFADNGNFVINALENLAGSADLISLRSRDTFARPFTRVEALRAEADTRFRETEQRLQSELAETERKLTELQEARGDGADLLMSPEQEAEIDRFVEQRARIRTDLRAVQRDLDRSIESLGTRLKVINIALVPLLLSAVALIALWRRQRRSRG